MSCLCNDFTTEQEPNQTKKQNKTKKPHSNHQQEKPFKINRIKITQNPLELLPPNQGSLCNAAEMSATLQRETL